MAERIKWHRPGNDSEFNIEGRIKDVLSFSVLFSCSKYTAVERLFQEYNDSRGKISRKGRQLADQIFDHPENKRYVKSMRRMLADISGGGYDSEECPKIEISEKRKNEALQSLLDQAIKVVEKGGLDPDTLKTVSDIFKKIGLLKDDAEIQEAPRRYLPVTCSQCDYKRFIDEQIELGNIREIQQS